VSCVFVRINIKSVNQLKFRQWQFGANDAHM